MVTIQHVQRCTARIMDRTLRHRMLLIVPEPEHDPLGRRARQTAPRRPAILDAAEELPGARRVDQVSLEEIATRADVARGTVYGQFGNRSGLLTALVERVVRRAGLSKLAAAMQVPDPVQSLEVVLDVGTQLWAQERRLHAALRSAAFRDPAVASVLVHRAAARREAMRSIIHRLADAGE